MKMRFLKMVCFSFAFVFVFIFYSTNAFSSIVYVSDESGHEEIWVMDDDGSNSVKLTDTETEKSCPKWSPDGSKIAYRNEYSDDYYEICVMDTDGSNIESLSTDPDLRDIAWGPNSQTIYYSHSRNKFSSIGIDGSGETLVYEHTPFSGTHGFVNFDLSKDGEMIAYTGEDVNWTPNDEIFIYNIKKSERTKLYGKDSHKDGDVAFSPDNKFIVWETDEDTDPYSNKNRELWRINIDGSNLTKFTNSYKNKIFISPCYSNDGSYIYLQAESLPRDNYKYDIYKYDIYKMDADGANLENLTNTPNIEERDPDHYGGTDGGTGCYTKAELDAQYQAGIEFCKNNPSACGISTGGTTPCPPSGTTIINNDLSFSIQNAVYQSPFGNMNLEAKFKVFGEQNGKLLWELESYKAK